MSFAGRLSVVRFYAYSSWAKHRVALYFWRIAMKTKEKVVFVGLDASRTTLNRPQFARGSKVSMDGAYGKK
jgi:hypothetical protein